MCALYQDQDTGDTSVMIIGGKYIFNIHGSSEKYSPREDSFQYFEGYPGEGSFGASVVQVLKYWIIMQENFGIWVGAFHPLAVKCGLEYCLEYQELQKMCINTCSILYRNHIDMLWRDSYMMQGIYCISA